MSELKHCPFCGGKVIIGPTEKSTDTEVHCRWCGGSAPSVEEWNTRHGPEGYALVPVEPTDAMKETFFGLTFPERVSITPIHMGDFNRRYKAMIAEAQESEK